MTTIEFLDQPHDEYRAGACNIGPAEIARRRRSGVLGLAAAAGLGLVLLAVDAAPMVRLLMFLPLFSGILGLVQAQMRFCVGFGAMGVRNFGALGSTSKVEAHDALRADRRKAVAVTVGVALVAGALAVAFAALPI